MAGRHGFLRLPAREAPPEMAESACMSFTSLKPSVVTGGASPERGYSALNPCLARTVGAHGDSGPSRSMVTPASDQPLLTRTLLALAPGSPERPGLLPTFASRAP